MSASLLISETLGLPWQEEPVSYYRLLGIPPGESDHQVIENAAYRQMMRVQAAADEFPSDQVQQLLDRLASARDCLLDTHSRRVYDQSVLASEGTPAPTSGADIEVPPTNTEDSLERSEWTLGAAKDCDIVIDDPYVSRRHCRIVFEEGKYWIEDLGSCNGTFINSDPVVKRKEIALGDSIGLGKTLRIDWSQFVEKQRQLHPHEDRPLLVNVARRTLRRGEGCPVIPTLEELSSTQIEPAVTPPPHESAS